MPYAVIQASAKVVGIASPSLTSAATDWTNPVGNGHTIIVIVWTEKSPLGSVPTVTDSNGNAYTKDVEASFEGSLNEDYNVSVHRCYAASAGNKPLITVTGTPGARTVFAALEVDGLDATVTSPSTNSNTDGTGAATTATAGSISTLKANGFVVAAVVVTIDANNTFSIAGSFTSYVQETSSSSPAVPGDGAARFYDAPTTVNPTWTLGTASSYGAVVVAYTANPTPIGMRLKIGGTLPVGGIWKKTIGTD